MFKITGPKTNEKVALNIENIKSMTRDGVTKAFYKIGNDLKRDAAKEIRKKPKRGRLYLIDQKGRTVLHRASAPGEAPANLTGNLVKGLTTNVVGWDRLQFGVKNNVKYAKGLELGAFKFISGGTEVIRRGREQFLRNLSPGVKPVSPRPYLLPAIKKNYNKIEVHFRTQIQQEIEGNK